MTNFALRNAFAELERVNEGSSGRQGWRCLAVTELFLVDLEPGVSVSPWAFWTAPEHASVGLTPYPASRVLISQD